MVGAAGEAERGHQVQFRSGFHVEVAVVVEGRVDDYRCARRNDAEDAEGAVDDADVAAGHEHTANRLRQRQDPGHVVDHAAGAEGEWPVPPRSVVSSLVKVVNRAKVAGPLAWNVV